MRDAPADQVPTYTVRRKASVVGDIAAIRARLVRAYLVFGDRPEDAAVKAMGRLRGALDYMQTFAVRHYRGTAHPGSLEGIRHVTNDDFVYYF